MNLREHLNWKTIVFSLLVLIGLWLLLFSVNLGSDRAYKFLLANGGGMDTGKYLLAIELYIKSYINLGSILIVIGGFGLLKQIK